MFKASLSIIWYNTGMAINGTCTYIYNTKKYSMCNLTTGMDQNTLSIEISRGIKQLNHIQGIEIPQRFKFDACLVRLAAVLQLFER